MRIAKCACRHAVALTVVAGTFTGLGPAVLGGAKAAADTSSSNGNPCITATAPSTLLNSQATSAPLRGNIKRSLDMPSTVPAGVQAVVVQTRIRGTQNGDLTLGPVGTTGTPVLHVVQNEWTSATTVVNNPGSQLTATYLAGPSANAQATVEIVGYIQQQGCYASGSQSAAADTTTGIGLPASGSLATGSITPINLVTGPAALPATAGAALAEVTVTASTTSSTTVSLVSQNTPPATVATWTVPAGGKSIQLQDLPPNISGGYTINVTGGPAGFNLTPIGWFANSDAYAQSGDQVVNGSNGTLQAALNNFQSVTVPLPQDVMAAAGAVTIAVTVKPIRDTTLYLWPQGQSRPTVPTAEFIGSQTGSQNLILAAPTGSGFTLQLGNGNATVSAAVTGWSPQPPAVNQPVPGVTHIVDATQITGGSIDNTTNTSAITYTGGDKMHLGDIIAAGVTDSTPDGLLGIVTGLQTTSTGTVVQMRAGSLQDAVPNADVESGNLDASSADPPQDDSPALPPEPAPDSSTSTAPASLARPAASNTGTLPSSAHFACSAGASATITASLKLNSSIDLSAHWKIGHPVEVDFGYSGGVYGSVALNLNAAAQCQGQAHLNGPTLPRITFAIGPVPVVITPQLSMNANVTGIVYGAYKASAAVQATLATGVRYANGQYNPYFTPQAGFGVTIGGHAGATISAKVTPRLDLKVYGVAGPYADISAAAKGHIDFQANPWWTAQASLGGGVGLDLNVWLVHASFGIEKDFFTWDAGHAPGAYPGPVVTSTSLANAVKGTYYQNQLAASGAPPSSFYLVGGSLPPGLSMNRNGQISGIPASTGSYQFDVHVIDSTGYGSAGNTTVTLTVDDATPINGGGGGGGGGGGQITISKGRSAVGEPNCTDQSCAWIDVSATGLPASSQVTITCFSSLDTASFYTYNERTDGTGNGNWPGECYYGYPGQTVWVTVNGIESNTLLW